MRPNSLWCLPPQWKAPGPAGRRGLSAPWAAVAVTTSGHARAPAPRRPTVETSAWDSTQRRPCATLTPVMVRKLLPPCIYFFKFTSQQTLARVSSSHLRLRAGGGGVFSSRRLNYLSPRLGPTPPPLSSPPDEQDGSRQQENRICAEQTSC